MKLKNLLIASLALLTFASCSKDSESDIPPAPKQPVDAVLSFLVTAGPSTKADALPDTPTDDPTAKPGSEPGTGKETDVRSLNAYVFNEGGQLIGSSRAEAKEEENLTKIDSILIKIIPGENDGPSAENFKLVVLANVADIKVSSLEELQGKTLTNTIDNYALGALLPMNSKVIEFTNVKPSVRGEDGYTVNNWIGNSGSVRGTADEGTSSDKEIALNRMVARVQVESVTMDLSDKYPGASFRLDTISMVNVRSQAKLPEDGTLGTLGALGTGDFVKGYQSSQYKDDASGVIVPGNTTNIIGTLWKSYFKDGKNIFGYKGDKADNEEIIKDESAVTDLSKKHFCCYIFPNEKGATYETALLLSGYFKRREGDTPELKHYMVKLNNEGVTRVLANNIYKLSITLNGEGSSDENHPEITAGVSVEIKVAPWTVIDQIEDDTTKDDTTK